MNTKFLRNPAYAALEEIDAELRTWALSQGCEEQNYPVLIDSATLGRAGYPEAFPHLLMSPVVAADPAQPFDKNNLALTDWCLSPAVCYHTYAGLEGQTFDPGILLTARGHCFRNELPEHLSIGRRQIEFQMREIVLVGSPAWIEQQLALLQPGVENLGRTFGIEGTWQPANDPFFLPRALGKSRIQRLLGTKLEWCLDDGLAMASINRHRDFFGERFHLRDATGEVAHTACLAFGLDRWTAHIL